ncbi:dihydropteroate synthase [Nocardia huaxiensis]|uniref:Dihydropteroate synthase n=1 Tax=Nocardia huaxiensis TaxID=2755382 RepID=A0A7D6ZLI2_9NOCA|nr:dihydropteroate synthase [Nocardia huaxiensis]QLY34099.1 dihydropteroate synthase [Nocardia huaxiensis]UFT00218.1 dihydropteroate synthase [Nocardia huaxiensis]
MTESGTRGTGLVVPRGGRSTVVMGVVNVTSDSFSDGGRYLDPGLAVAHGLELYEMGADIVDVGGESTRPGAVRVDPEIEAARVVPVIRELAAAGVPTSVDTMRASVAEAALEAGVTMVNDVSGGRADADMVKVVAAAKVPWILMHWRADADYRHTGPAEQYDDVVRRVWYELHDQVDAALAGGVAFENLILDPGLGFAKNAEHNWELLGALFAGLTEMSDYLPVLIGASRKRFLGTLLADSDGPRSPDGREIATATISALAAEHGAWGVRVHDVRASLDSIAVADASTRAAARVREKYRLERAAATGSDVLRVDLHMRAATDDDLSASDIQGDRL